VVKCRNCGADIAKDSKFCTVCGAEQTPAKQTTNRPTAAFMLSLLAGIFILGNGLFLAFPLRVSGFLRDLILRYASIGAGATFSFTIESLRSVLTTLMILGIVFGLIVILASIMVYKDFSNKTLWSVLILVTSILSIITGGGFLIGFILGIIGGALGLTWRPPG